MQIKTNREIVLKLLKSCLSRARIRRNTHPFRNASEIYFYDEKDAHEFRKAFEMMFDSNLNFKKFENEDNAEVKIPIQYFYITIDNNFLTEITELLNNSEKAVAERLGEKYFIKNIRADFIDFFDRFMIPNLTHTANTRHKKFHIRRKDNHKNGDWTTLGIAPFIFQRPIPPQYTLEEKMLFSQPLPATYVTTKYVPEMFTFRGNDPIVGIALPKKNILPSRRLFKRDVGSVGAHWNTKNQKDAIDYYQKHTSPANNILFGNLDELEVVIDSETNKERFNEVIIRMQFDSQGNSFIVLGDLRFDSKMLALERSRQLRVRLKERAQELNQHFSNHYYVPICYYLPKKREKHLQLYGLIDRAVDIEHAFEIYSKPHVRLNEYYQGNFEFLLAFPDTTFLLNEKVNEKEHLIPLILKNLKFNVLLGILQKANQAEVAKLRFPGEIDANRLVFITTRLIHNFKHEYLFNWYVNCFGLTIGESILTMPQNDIDMIPLYKKIETLKHNKVINVINDDFKKSSYYQLFKIENVLKFSTFHSSLSKEPGKFLESYNKLITDWRNRYKTGAYFLNPLEYLLQEFLTMATNHWLILIGSMLSADKVVKQDFNVTDIDGATLLMKLSTINGEHFGAKKIEILKSLKPLSLQISLQDRNGNNALMYAISSVELRYSLAADVEYIKLLAEWYMNQINQTKQYPNMLNNQGHNSLSLLLSRAKYYTSSESILKVLAVLPSLLNNVNVVTLEGKTPLMYAVLSEKFDIVQQLINKYPSINIDEVDVEGMTALTHTCLVESADDALAMAKLLVQSGANVNVQDGEGQTPLFHAIKKGHPALIKFLLNQANSKHFEIRDKKGRGLLFYALLIKDADLSLELLKKILDQNPKLINQPDNDGLTPLEVAIRQRNVEMVSYILKHTDCLHNIPLNKKSQNALDISVEIHHEELATLFYPEWIKPNPIIQPINKSLLFIAIEKNWVKLVATMVKNPELDINMVEYLDTPLSAAVINNRVDIVILLLKANANPQTIINEQIGTVLEWAMVNNHSNVLEILLSLPKTKTVKNIPNFSIPVAPVLETNSKEKDTEVEFKQPFKRTKMAPSETSNPHSSSILPLDLSQNIFAPIEFTADDFAPIGFTADDFAPVEVTTNDASFVDLTTADLPILPFPAVPTNQNKR